MPKSVKASTLINKLSIIGKPKDPRYIEITFGPIKELRPVYSNPDLVLSVEYLGETILTTDKFLYQESTKSIAAVNLTIDLLDYSSVDNLISNPLIVSLVETPGPQEELDLLPPARDGKAKWRSEESILDLEEALLGTRTVPEKDVANKVSATAKKSTSKTTGKGKDGTKGSSKEGKLNSGMKIPNQAAVPKLTGPQPAGTAILDLLPLFLGEQIFYETIILKGETSMPLDDRTPPKARLPRIQVQIKINAPIPPGSLYNITVESLFNLPNVISENMSYKMVLHIPAVNYLTIPFNDYKYATEPRKQFTNKRWYGIDRDMNYYINGNLEKVKSCFSARASDVMSEDTPRVDYNVMKRNFASAEDLEVLKQHIKNYRSVVAEILIEKAPVNAGKDGGKKGGEKDSKGTGSKKDKSAETDQDSDSLHCMAYLDMCRLLYPGQTTVRIAAPLRTFNYEEAETTVGLKYSHFRPRLSPESSNLERKSSRNVKDAKKGKDNSKKGSSKSGNISSKLPQQPPPPEPSKLIYDESGMPTFILIQFEFQEPLVKARELHDLREELSAILFGDEEVKKLGKAVESSFVTENLYKDTLRTITLDIKRTFVDFQESISRENLTTESEKGTVEAFLEYLKEKGIYQTYLGTITRAMAAHVNSLHDFNPQISSGDYQKFISRTYALLVEKMNTVLNELFKVGFNPTQILANRNEDLLRYGYEAMELGLTNLANRYFLQRICDDDTNPNYWFDYAVFQMHINSKEKAFECVKEALRFKSTHRNSLVFYALTLSEQKRYKEAETLLLSVTLNDPTWVEGWGALYCIYFKKTNLEGMDVCIEIGQKNLEIHPAQKIYDNSWSRSLIPNTFFYRTACYFISLRFFNEAQMMIVNELTNSNEAVNEYLLSVISFLKKDYDHAILHIDNSMQYGGCDFTKTTLRGHILANKGIYKCALEEYKKIFKLYEQPIGDYVYFVYVRSGLAYSQIREDQNARVAFLHACKLNGGTAFTWLSAGILFYLQQDYLSAEDCLTQSNTMDNRLPETWAYLALVNTKLKKLHEATMCLHQAEKYKLDLTELLELARREVDGLSRQFSSI